MALQPVFPLLTGSTAIIVVGRQPLPSPSALAQGGHVKEKATWFGGMQNP